MSEVSIRRVPFENIVDVTSKLVSYAFRDTPPLPSEADMKREFSYYEDASTYAIFEGETPVTSASSSPLQMNIRGHLYQTGGLWAVSTLPTARRKGYARDIVCRFFQHLHEEEQAAFTTLYAFRESFYTRLGYIAFPQPQTVRFSPNALQPLLKKELTGQVEMLDTAEGYEIYDQYMRQHLQKTHGMALFAPRTHAWMKDKNSYWLAIARVGSEIKGMMRYKRENETLKVHAFFYDDHEGLYLLLEWLARHIDHVKEVELQRLNPHLLPETWWPDLYVKRSSEEPALGRVLCVERLGGMKTGVGSFTTRITDPYCPWNEGIYRFESIEGKLHVSSATQAECELSIHGLTALILGAHDPSTFVIREWGNPSQEIQAIMRTMFPAQKPYQYIAY